MRVRMIESGETLGARRSEVVACIPVYGGHDMFVECLRSVVAHTAPSVPIMILDDASPDPRTGDYVRGLEGADDDHELLYLRRERNIGFPANVNGAFAAAAPADVVVLNSDCVVTEGWLEGLRAAAYDSSLVATATALTNHGSIVSTPNPSGPGAVSFGPEDLDGAAAAVRRYSRRLRPRLPTAIGHCMYVRRAALELVGDFDLAFTPGYGEEVDFSQRCLLSGLCHVLADDVLVLHHGGGSFALNEDRSFFQESHERDIGVRYPYYHDGLRALAQTDGRLSLALRVAGRALSGLAVTIDLRGLEPGTEAWAAAGPLLGALLDTGEVRLTVIAPDLAQARSSVAPQHTEQITWWGQTELDRAGFADVVHRLSDVADLTELEELQRLGGRLVLTHRNLSRFHNPACFAGFVPWEAHRLLVRRAMRIADGVVCLSDCARADAVAEGLVGAERAHTVVQGLDHRRGRAPAHAPQLLRGLPAQAETIVCLGASARQSNRLFALRLVEALQERHQWDGRLLLAGAEAEYGSSFDDERRHLARNPRLAEATHMLSSVDAAERGWLLARAGLLLVPAIGTDLDLTPFEAAEYGTPSLWAPQTSLSELVVDERDSTLVPWDADASAGVAFALLRDAERRARNLAAIRVAGAGLTWDAAADRLLAAYGAAFARDARVQASPREGLTDGRVPDRPGRVLTRRRRRVGRHGRGRSPS